MAEPLHNSVYDQDDDQPVTRPNLHAVDGEADSGGAPKGRDTNDGKGPVSKPDLQADEAAGGTANTDGASSDEAGKLDDRVGKGFTGGGVGSMMNQTPMSMIAGKLLGNKKKKAATGGILAIAVAGIFGWSSTVLPTKLIGITTGLQSEGFAAADQATEDMEDNFMKHYLIKHVMPGMIKNNCTSTRVTKSCADVSDSSTPAGALYQAWRDGNIERKLFEQHGIEIRREGTKFYLHTPQIKERVALGDLSGGTREFEGKAFAALSRSDVSREFRIARQNTTFRQRIMFRYSLEPMLKRKYGVRRCIMTCKVADKANNINDKVDLKKQSFKNYLTERVLLPRTDMLGLAVACATNGFDCTDYGEADENGERTNKFEQDVRARLAEHQARFGQSSLEDLDKQSEEIRTKGFIQFSVEKILGETLGKVALKGVPVLGWIDLGAKFISGAQNMGPAFTNMAYTVNTTSMVAVFSMYRTAADEVKTQKADPTELGSITSSLEARKGADQNGASAEEHPAYAQLLGSKSIKTASLEPAASAESNVYPCDDGPFPAGQLACPEETVRNANGGVSNVTKSISDTANLPLFASAGWLADFWNNTAGHILNAVSGVFGDAASLLIPGWVKDRAADIAKSVVETITNYAIPPIVKLTSSGGRLFIMMANGAFTLGNDFTHQVLGAGAVSPAVAEQIRENKMQQEKEDFSRRPLYARIFDKDSQYSVVTQVAMALPSNFSDASTQSQNLVRDPLRSIASIFSSLLRGPSISAAASKNPSGTTDYAWNRNHPVFHQDPDKTWHDYDCNNPDNKKNWGNSAVANDNTVVPVNYDSNPCMLEETSAGASGGRFDTGLIKDFVDQGAGTGGDGGGSGTVSGDAAELAQKIIDLAHQNKIVIGDYSESPTSDRADRSLASQQLEDIAAGKQASGTTRCSFSVPSKISPNVKLLQFLVDLGGQYKYTINSLFGQCHSAGSNHYNGTAVDFACPMDIGKASAVGEPYGVSRYTGEDCDNAGHYHYSVGGR